MAQSSISPAMLQEWIAKQQMMQQIASMGGMPQAPSGIDGASQMMPGAPSIESLMAQPTGPMGRGRPSSYAQQLHQDQAKQYAPQASKPSLMDMMGGSQAPQPAPANLLDMMGGSQAGSIAGRVAMPPGARPASVAPLSYGSLPVSTVPERAPMLPHWPAPAPLSYGSLPVSTVPERTPMLPQMLDNPGAPPIAFDGRQLQSLAPPPMAMMASQAPTPAGLPSFRNPPKPAMMSPELAAKRKATAAAEYTIKKGDTLSAIAKRNGKTVMALLAKNPQIKDANKIFVGKKI